MPHSHSPEFPSPRLASISMMPRTVYMRHLAALRVANLDRVCGVFRDQVLFFNASTRFRNLSEWIDLPTESAARRFLNTWVTRPLGGPLSVWESPCRFLELPPEAILNVP